MDYYDKNPNSMVFKQQFAGKFAHIVFEGTK